MSSVSFLALLAPGAVTAAEWEINIGGYMETYLAFSSYDLTGGLDHDGVDVGTGADAYFRPAITVDNGLTLGADFNIEGQAGTAGDPNAAIDEAYVFVKGSFGEILIGQ